MAVIRTGQAEFQGGGEYLAAIGLLCGIMASIMVLKFRGFSANLDFTKKSNNSVEQQTVTVVSEGVYRPYTSERYDNGSALPSVHKPISPSMVKLPPSSSGPSKGGNTSDADKLNIPKVPPPLPRTPPPFQTPPSFNILDNTSGPHQPISKGPTSPITMSQPMSNQKIPPPPSPVSYDPKGATISRMKSTDLKITSRTDHPKQSKKEEKEREQQEKQRIKEQRKKDKEFISLTLKEDTERVSREAELRKHELNKKEAKKSDKTTSKKDDNKPKKKEDKKSNNKALKAVNPLAEASIPAASTDTLRSGFSTDSAPPPYTRLDRSKMEATPSETDSSGNTSFSKPVNSTGGSWDMVSQHRQQMRRPANEQASSKTGSSQNNVADRQAATIQIGIPQKSVKV